MKKLEDDNLKNLVKETLIEKAPTGMVDRIMANIAVHPARRVSVAPVEPNPVIAAILPVLTIVSLLVAVILKPVSLFSVSWSQYFDFDINTIWIAPVIAFALTIWGYIFFRNHDFHLKGRR